MQLRWSAACCRADDASVRTKIEPHDLRKALAMRKTRNRAQEERRVLANYWQKELSNAHNAEIEPALGAVERRQKAYKQAFAERSMCSLRSVAVVGMTTTAAAKRQHILKALGAGVAHVEEVAEVLEVYSLSSLSESAENLIMIGGHKQLRPPPKRLS